MKLRQNDPVAWRYLDPYLDEALSLDVPAREIWFKELAVVQPAVVQVLRQLVAERDVLNARGFLAQTSMSGVEALKPAFEDLWKHHEENSSQAYASDRSVEGAVVGVYRLIREIGQGGMSSVWLAERCDGQLTRHVALKLPLVSPRTLRLADRFQRERDILATLTHPNIARLYDAGIDADNQPYMAMEFVEGTGLTEHCDVAHLSLAARLRLFLQVLEAVQFAHTQLVLHRDLKPSNILVTREGRVVLLDFGIAKLLNEEGTAETPATEMVLRALTPHYASPEHISGKILSAASDVYSLGVVLYELLTGQRPYRLQNASRAMLEQAVLERDVVRPSRVVVSPPVAAARGTTPIKLTREIRGDLDAIVLKALIRNPCERYSSAAALSQDIVNYLEGRPVSAQPPRRSYVLRKFIARNRFALACACVAMGAVIAGTGVAIWQAHCAAQDRDRAFAMAARNAAVTEFMGALITDAADGSKPVTLDELLERGEKMARSDSGNSPVDRAAVLAMIGARYGALGDRARAEKVLGDAIGLLRDTDETGLRAQLSCARASALADLGQRDTAIRVIDGELAHLAADPENAAYCLLYRSFIAAQMDDAAGALRFAMDGLKRYHVAPRATAVDEGLLLGAVGWGEHLNGRNGEADGYYRRALDTYAKLGRERSANALTLQNNWALVIDSAGAPARALELYDKALQALPQGSTSAFLTINRARALESLGRYPEAQTEFARGFDVAKDAQDDIGQAHALFGMASTAERLGDPKSAASHLDQLAELPKETIPPGSPAFARVGVLRGQLYLDESDADAALTEFTRALAGKGNEMIMIDALLGKAEAHLRLGDARASADAANLALTKAMALQGGVDYSNRTGLAWASLARAWRAADRNDEAQRALTAALTNLSHTVDASHPALVELRSMRIANSG